MQRKSSIFSSSKRKEEGLGRQKYGFCFRCFVYHWVVVFKCSKKKDNILLTLFDF